VPDGILVKEELVPILTDIHLAQAAIGINQSSDSSRYSIDDYKSYLFNYYHISKQKYDSSLSFYSLHPEMLNEIYKEVINELSKKQGEVERK
jgi:hypothetical protein